ncbi:uncharacterized protein LOC130995462 [Salvia miltiorrhiza]|uniref:uncharacterized protein LOC130995462 n=1 Tax=Salvia miltiorrhiza TaxID=226208 RepID=UPI0025ABBF53|nr:uncharacterized protein LOC130995462 [Salvia miltiorrhiza]XP_057776730.1 uncharacterized protein LOC130995462 [Salvia miltiorrhiza]XP_057776731.1 uncharacterized protein LOC130995462 [Salvia miltiorrhiza]XP_057776732.1 uncharacterized protein LOC130995462 [Salvia miltiorrhiza]XP_057776733.1 uncharacterized protein LOC130995462 [Salvia miltiorrhiza]
MASRKRSISNDSDMSHLYKELDEALCPICMDHPHNAVLLICSSHDKSCRSYICDTSYRHSNCLDRFKKLKEENVDNLSATSLVPEGNQDSVLSGNLDLAVMTDHANHTETRTSSMEHMDMRQGDSGGHSTHNANPSSGEREGRIWGSLDIGEPNMEKSEEVSNLRCPLCRGRVLGWKVVEEARKYLNLKTRSCSHESCLFSGSYRELRRHARRVHPTVRPADVDPSRQRAWHRLEGQREYNDIVSAIRSAMPGAVVFGDYVIDGGDRLLGERDRNGGAGEGSRLLSTLFLFQMFGSLEPGAEPRGGRSRQLARHRRAAGTSSRRRYLWGENLLGHQDDEDDEDDEDHDADLNILSDLGDNAPPNPRRRRRLTRAESDEDQQ